MSRMLVSRVLEFRALAYAGVGELGCRYNRRRSTGGRITRLSQCSGSILMVHFLPPALVEPVPA